ncbi:diaminopimelate decarboxylase [Conexibacter sp. DBS9H8]|uniref:diaminopimelate decarboxylase n=1 Tax=Conexibacter sp. DBS9H8 TaxID=2937801 RepID=UPI00200D7CAF|nr:diaminopimelate decarboxylase [Conexibacter sp. DBS9H8]
MHPTVSLPDPYPATATINAAGHLEVGGCDLVALASEFGTPAYIVDEADLRARARAFRAGLADRHPDSDVLFASKAFPCSAVYRVLAEEGLACDVASGGELALALGAGFDPARIYLHGNAKSLPELAEAMRAGVGQIVIDSLDDLDRTERVAGELGRRQAVLLRVTPDVRGETHDAISTGQADSKFGFGLAEAPGAIDRAQRSPHLHVLGLHCHIGSQLLDLAPFERAVAALAELGRFPVYNLGGGLGVAYLADQRPPAIAAYLDVLIAAAHARLGPEARLLIEPGRALVANTTLTLYEIQTVKRNVSTWVAVDGGMSDNLRPMLYGSRYEVALAGRMHSAGSGEPCVLAGKHCESGDVIARDIRLADPRPGEIVVTPATGAYGHAMANNYNGVPRPPVIFVAGGKARVVVRRETYADLAARDV